MSEGNLIPSSSSDPVRPQRIEAPADPILARMRFLARLLDNSILLPGGYRIGIDPIIGLVPAAGDFIASALSLWLVWDGLRLGLPKRVIARMLGNIVLETLVGAIPVLGDFIDAAFKANARNMRLAEMHYSPGLKKRPATAILGTFAAASLVILAVWALALYSVFRFLAALWSKLIG